MNMKILIVCLLSIVLFSGCEFTFVGRNEHAFNVNVVNYKKFTVELENTELGEEKYGIITIKDGDSIAVSYDLIGSSAAKVSVYESSDRKRSYGYHYLTGEGRKKFDNLPDGDYEIVVSVEQTGTTGEIEISTEKNLKKSTNNS